MRTTITYGKSLAKSTALLTSLYFTCIECVRVSKVVYGYRCTYRIFNRKRSLAPLENGFRPLPSNPDNETWLFWHTGTAANMQDLMKTNPSYLFSPELINWQADVYFQFRAELTRIGCGSFSCPSNISSGIHGILLALQVCENVNVFGFSLDVESLITRGDSVTQRINPAHSWSFDTLLLRYLAMSRMVDICTQ